MKAAGRLAPVHLWRAAYVHLFEQLLFGGLGVRVGTLESSPHDYACPDPYLTASVRFLHPLGSMQSEFSCCSLSLS